jgi:diguanylate cyclase (GGDEF)-like protein
VTQDKPWRRHTPRRKPWLFFLAAFAVTASLVAAVSYTIISYAQSIAEGRLVESLKQAERQTVAAMRREAEGTLVEVTADALTFRDYIANNLLPGADTRALHQTLISFMDSHRAYDQLRLIDSNGRERLRIQNYETGAVSIDAGDLQVKSGTTYFRRATELKGNQVLVSQLEPNVENGSVEIPLKPVIRVIVRVPDHGYLVFNYLASNLLESMESIGRAGLGEPQLVGQLGVEALTAMRSSTAEAFAATLAENRFSDAFPDAWRTMNASPGDSVDDGFGGFMVFDRLFPSELQHDGLFLTDVSWTLPTDSVSNTQGGWFVISHIDRESLAEIANVGLGQSTTMLFVSAALVALIALFAASWLTRQRSLAARLRVLASRDPLTKLFNRGEFEDRLEAVINHSKRFGRHSGLLFIDLDDFKQINDSLGHTVGDDLLLHVANILRSTLRNSDVIGRVGGDEFAVVLTEVSNAGDTENVVHNLKENLCRQVILGGKTLKVSASIGSANFPEDGTSIAELYEKADLAMYESKLAQRDAIADPDPAPALSGL